jgi:prevent-host-death family protein
MRKKPYSLYEAKTQLSRLVDRAAAGEEIVIAKHGKPKARLVPLPAKPKRVPGGWEGKVWIAENFDDPLPKETERAFYEGEIEPSS